jgi:acetyl-CoA carboxylase carboxyltransferase component
MCIRDRIKALFTYIPWNNEKKAERFASKGPKSRQFKLDSIFPTDPMQPYDVRDIIRSISDESEFFEVQELWAANIVIGFARLDGQTVGFVANQPMVLAGVLDVDSSDKAARFIRFCDAFNIPLVTLVDLPGYLPGVDQEHSGVIRHGAKVLYAYSEATVPKLTVILRKAYGGGYIAMCSHHLRADFVFAWPTAEIAVMGPEGAANIIFRSEIKASDNPEETRKRLIEEYRQKFANPYVAAAYGYVDAVIEPNETRNFLIHSLNLAQNNREIKLTKKHGIPPF